MIGLSTRSWRRVATWCTFSVALITYLLTLEPDASFWDCPEYLVTAARLEVGHPPGNPLWTLTARIFSLAGGSDPQYIAVCVNASSAIFTAGAAALLASVMFILLTLLVSPARCRCRSLRAAGAVRRRMFPVTAVTFLSVAAGLTLAWSDSVWFSAVEAEVYAMSLFLTALTVRLMVGYALMRDRRRRARQVLLIVYLTGLSVGVHQLNLLTIPALVLIWLFRRYPYRKPGALRVICMLAGAVAAVGIILLGFMPGVIWFAGKTELFCVNTLGMPLHSGVWICWGLLLAVAIMLPMLPRIVGRHLSLPMLTLAWIPAMLLTGFSVYMILLVRGAANPPMNEGAPSNIFTLAEYLNRDQYGKTPLLYGRTPHSRVMRQEVIRPDGTPDYSKAARKNGSPRYLPSPDGRSYRHFADNYDLIYTPELDMWLPRMTSGDGADVACYGDWAGMTPDAMESVEVSYALDSVGNPVGKLNTDGSRTREKELRPTYLQQLRYLLSYQIGYMYMRYLLWNYSGRQNDRFATGEAEHGNFITGIPLIDDAMLGPQSAMPAEIGHANRGRNVFYLVPLLLGILGMVWLQRQGRLGRRANMVILVLFVMTGLAIVIYLNQSPREVRERDYSFLGSLWAYSLWIGAGIAACVVGVLHLASRRIKDSGIKGLAIALSASSLLLPAWMLAVNYDDHDRSGRTATTDYAANLLESLEPDAILFTNGDNFTFPLWWAQEVAGIRRDVTIINTAYLITPWYICQLMQEAPGAETGTTRPGLLMQAADTAIRYGTFATNPYGRTEVIPSRADTLTAVEGVEALRRRYAAPDTYRMPGMLKLGLPAPLREETGKDTIYLRSQAVASGSGMIGQRQLAAFDIIASNLLSGHPRPVYWLSSLTSSDFAGFYPFTTRTLHTRRLVYTDSVNHLLNNRLLDIDLEAAAHNRPGNMNHPGIYADATVGPQITIQRLGLLRLGQRLLAAGRKADALRVARILQRDYPADVWEYQICNEAEGAVFEGLALADLLIRSSSAAGADSVAMRAEGELLLKRERDRHAEWLRYRDALPPRLRSVLTPKHRQFIINFPDSLP
ncbi:MAG: DUF2723 domain-containing protein [Muribaculaceae bacterium]|nr:DUF2723 domain-containing protein [Muribaculaceae bacterium]